MEGSTLAVFYVGKGLEQSKRHCDVYAPAAYRQSPTILIRQVTTNGESGRVQSIQAQGINMINRNKFMISASLFHAARDFVHKL